MVKNRKHISNKEVLISLIIFITIFYGRCWVLETPSEFGVTIYWLLTYLLYFLFSGLISMFIHVSNSKKSLKTFSWAVTGMLFGEVLDQFIVRVITNEETSNSYLATFIFVAITGYSIYQFNKESKTRKLKTK